MGQDATRSKSKVAANGGHTGSISGIESMARLARRAPRRWAAIASEQVSSEVSLKPAKLFHLRTNHLSTRGGSGGWWRGFHKIHKMDEPRVKRTWFSSGLVLGVR